LTVPHCPQLVHKLSVMCSGPLIIQRHCVCIAIAIGSAAVANAATATAAAALAAAAAAAAASAKMGPAAAAVSTCCGSTLCGSSQQSLCFGEGATVVQVAPHFTHAHD
jgi:type IV secretory pathway TrbL component